MKKDIFKGITLMNTLLCFCVVMIHLTSVILPDMNKESLWYDVIFVLNNSLFFSVPGFIFLSGFKLYSRYRDSKVDIKSFYLKRLRKIVVPYIICVLINFLYFYSKKWITVDELASNIFLGTGAAHFYYIIIAVQLYLVFPFLKDIFIKYTNFVVVASLISTLCFQIFLNFTYSDRFIGTYIFYFVLGMVFARYRCYEKGNKYLLINIAICIVMGYIRFICSPSDELWKRLYSLAGIIYVTFSSITLYDICAHLGEKCGFIYRFTKGFANVSYNVYLYHILVMCILRYDVFPYFNLSLDERFALLVIIEYSAMILYSILKNRNISLRDYKTEKQKPSGPAIFMYAVILVSVITSAVCFFIYYGGSAGNNVVLWVGIVAFMLVYHLWGRIIMGNVSKLFKINPNHPWFKEWQFEKKLYKLLLVKKWKGKALTYNPEAFSLEKHSLDEIALVMTKSEVDHWINEGISLFSILFSLLWGETWIFVLTAVLAMVFDAQFIVIQRFNRPRILRILKKQSLKKEEKIPLVVS